MALLSRGRRHSFQQRLLAWYACHGRDLPWRRSSDPYAIFVSEILSHQTQISRVVPVYQRLIDRYPTVEALARAPLPEIKAVTDPLGYKVRGRWLQAGALQVAERGSFPTTEADLRRLPGFGRYTAGALMSFGHRLDVPAVDTNVRRVLLRHFAGTVPVPHTSRLAWQLAREVIPPGKAHLLNQAMMDVGAMVCRARAPRCPNCPLRRSCDFRRRR